MKKKRVEMSSKSAKRRERQEKDTNKNPSHPWEYDCFEDWLEQISGIKLPKSNSDNIFKELEKEKSKHR